MKLEVKAKLEGWVRWQVLDEHDQPVPVTLEGGREEWGGVWHHNLITNRGMDLFATETFSSTSGWRRYSQIGEGSAAPANTDTTLGALVQSTFDDGGFGNEQVTALQSGELVYEFTQRHLHTLSANRNLTEYGYAPDTTSGNTVIRELFRDAQGNPITLSVLAGKKVRIDHKLVVRAPFTVAPATVYIDEYDAANALTNTRTYPAQAYAYSSSSSFQNSVVSTVFAPNQNGFAAKIIGLLSNDAPDTNSGVSFSSRPSSSATSSTRWTLEPYINGSFKRHKTLLVSESDLNGDLYGLACSFSGTSSSAYGYAFKFDNNAKFTKQNTHTFTFGIEVSWARG